MANAPPPPDPLLAALADADRVVKKQKLTAASTEVALSSALAAVAAAAADVRGGGDPGAALAAAAAALAPDEAGGVVAAATKELHGAVARLGKVRREKRDGARASRSLPLAADASLSPLLYSRSTAPSTPTRAPPCGRRRPRTRARSTQRLPRFSQRPAATPPRAHWRRKPAWATVKRLSRRLPRRVRC